jgi:serine/threonine-protein kinase
MARDPQERFASADELAEAMEQWLEGDLKREQAEKLFGEAQAQRTEADSLRQQAEAKLAQATQLEAQVAPWEDASKKADIWRLQDEADELLLDAERKSQESELRLQEALVYEPQLHEARVALAEMCQRFHAEAEQAGRDVERVRVEQRLLRQVRALPASHARHGELSAYLKGDGTLTLLTEPTGAEVEIYEFAEDNRRLSAVNGRSLGLTPLMEVPVPKGSHILRIMLAGHDEVRLPISISRGEAWSMTPPGATTPVTLPLLRQGMLGQDERYVAPGWFLSGGSGDVAANSLPERRMWCDGFVLQRFPVTIGQYTAFLNTLWQEGKRDEAMRYVPRLSKEGDPLDSMVFFMRPSARGFMLDGSRLPPQANDLPVTYVDVLSAQAYARWYSGLTGHVWKLPDELTWEKAARGVDGRLFPWGNWMDPSWCCMIDSHPERPTLDIVTQWPVDKSPFGMRGAAGGVGDWCDNPFRVDGPATGETAAQPEQPGDRHSHARSNRPLDEHSIVAVRGGAWNEGASYTCCASRYGALAMGHFDNIGFRLVRWL